MSAAEGGDLPPITERILMKRGLISPDRLPEKGITIGNDQRLNLETEGRFPKRVPITARTYGYVEDEIDQWIEARIAERDKAVA
jgi:prophage regulatory protein